MEHMVTLLTTEQVIITSLKSAETEDNHIVIIMRGVWTHRLAFIVHAVHLVLLYSSYPQRGGSKGERKSGCIAVGYHLVKSTSRAQHQDCKSLQIEPAEM
jgi:hypothetical protein